MLKKIMAHKICQLSGYTMNPKSLSAEQDFFDKTIERIDNTIGYTKSNCICICYGVNQLKSVWENSTYPLSVKDVIKVAKNLEKRI